MEEQEQVNDPILAQLNSAPQKEEDDPILAQLNQESGGGASMGFTEGSQEPQEQPSQPSEEQIDNSLLQVNRIVESDATQVTEPPIPKGIALRPTRFIEEDAKEVQSQKRQFDTALKDNQESYDKILADGEAAGVVTYNKDGIPVVSDQLFIDELENVRNSSTQTTEAYDKFLKQSYIPAMQDKAKLDTVTFYNEQKDKGGFMAITNQNLFKGIGGIAEGAIDATYEVAVLPFVQQIADDPKKINESVKVFGENVGKLPLLMWSALNGRDDIVGKEPTMVSLSKMAAGFPMADPRLVSEEYEKDFTSSMLGEAYTGVIQSTPAMLSPFRKAAFFSQMYQAAGEEIDNKDLSQNSKTAYKLTSSLVNSALEEFGFRNLLSNKAVTAKIINNVISKSAGQKLGADAIRKLAKYETKTVAENYAKNVAGSYLAEAETGGLQSVFTNTLNETVNILKGEEVFDPKTAGEIVGDFFYDANMEGIGGLMMGAPISVATSRKTTGTDNLNDVQFAAMEQAVANKGLTMQYLTNLEKSGKITEEELNQASKIADEFEVIVGRLPKKMSIDNKRKAYNLLLDKAKIEEENEQLDPAFQKGNKDAIDAIDNKLTDLANEQTKESQDGTVRDRAQEEAQGQTNQEQSVEIPDEILNLQDNELITFTVKTLDEVPEQFRDKAKKIGGQDIETRKLILGLPLGKKETAKMPEAYVYVLTGKEAKDYAVKEAAVTPTEEVVEEMPKEAPIVTDESGEVVTVYRGGKSASGVQYYTSDRKLAESIGEAKGEGVQKATVRMANPWTPESLDVNNAPQWMQDWVRSQEEFTTVDEKTMAAEEIPMEQAIQEIKDMQLSFRDVGLWQSFVNEALEHHDGIIAFDPSEDMAADKKIYITKSPEQVVTEETTEGKKEVTNAEKTKIAEEIGKVRKVKPKNIKGLLDVMGGIFGLNKKQAESASVVGDVIIGNMAKRAGISKDEMYQKIAYQKAQKAPDGSLKQMISEDADGNVIFESSVKRGLSELPNNPMTPDAWVAQISKKGGRGTQEELYVIGVLDKNSDGNYVVSQNFKDAIGWIGDKKVDLKDQKAIDGKYWKSVPKEVVEKYINDNQIEIVEVTKGGSTPKLVFDTDVEGRWQAEDPTGTFSGDYTIQWLRNESKFELESADGFISLHNSFEEATDRANEHILSNQVGEVEGQTKYSGYTLEGGENYREVLLTLPQEKPANQYKSSHWDETNIVAHLRLNERTLPNGERVMFIEEVQSDWAQEGKKEGFDKEADEIKYQEFKKAQKEYAKLLEYADVFNEEVRDNPEYQPNIKIIKESGIMAWSGFPEFGGETVFSKGDERPTAETVIPFSELPESYQTARNKIKEISKDLDTADGEIKKLESKWGVEFSSFSRSYKLKSPELKISGIPDMPYKKTDQWVGMAMRRAMQMAAQEGFDRVAWVTGEQSADRYDLSKQVDRVEVADMLDGNRSVYISMKDNSDTQLFVDPKTGKILQSTDKGIDGKMLEDVVGKEISNKILNLNTEKESVISSEGLKIGGEGMKAFYNSILPKVAQKEAQRFDKSAKVKVVDFGDNTRKVIVDVQRDGSIRLINEGGGFIAEYNKNQFDEAYKEADRLNERIDNSQIVGRQLSIPITPEMRMNLNSAVPLFQGARGAMTAADGNYVVYALTNPNVSTPLHELAHVYEHYLTDKERADIESWSGHNAGTVEFSEAFARGFEKFLAGGKVNNPKLQKIFENFKEWLTEIYNGITGSEIDIELNDKMKSIYNEMLGATPEKVKSTQTVAQETKGLSEKEKTKQGFIEYTEAIKEKSREKLDAATDKIKKRLDTQVQKLKDFKERKRVITSFANSLLTDLKKSGVKYVPTAKVKTILNQVNAAKTEDSLRKSADKLIKTIRDIAVSDEEVKIKAQRKASVKQAKKNAKMGKFGDLESAYAISNLKEIPQQLEKEYYDVMSNLGQRGAFEIDVDAVNELYEKISKLPEVEQEQTTPEVKEKPDVTENLTAIEEATQDLTNENIKDLPSDYISNIRTFKEVPTDFLNRYSKQFLNGLEAAVKNASNGIMTGNAITSVVRDYEASLDAKDIVDNNILEKTAEQAKKVFKGASKIFTKNYYKNRKSKNVPQLVGELSNKYTAYFDSVLGSLKGTPIYEAFNNITSKKSTAESQTNNTKAEFTKKLKSAIRSRIPFIKRMSQVSGEPFFRLSVRSQLYLQQKQFESNRKSKGVQSVDDIIKNIKENLIEYEAAANLTPKEIEIIIDEYNKGAVDGSLSAEKMWADMNSKERDLIEFMRAELDKSGKKSEYINIAFRNNPLPQYKDYFPRSGSTIVTEGFDFFQSLKDGKLGRQSFKTRSSNERARTIDFISFSPFNDFMNHITSVNYDYYLTPEVSRFTSMTGQIGDIANQQETKRVAESMNQIMKATLNTSFNETNKATNSTFSDVLGRSVLGGVTRNLLIKPTRLISEFVFNYLPVVTLKSKSLLKTLPERKAFNKVDALKKIQERFGSVQQSRVGAYKLDMKDLGQGLDKRFNSISSEVKDAAERFIRSNYLTDFSKGASQLFYEITDSAAKPIWEATFLEEFKKESGSEFDAAEFVKDNNEYSDKYKRSIEKAKARADKRTSAIFNTAERMESKLNQQKRTGMKSLFYDFMQSFAYNEAPAIKEAVHSTLGHGAYGRMEGVTTLLALSTRAVGYQVLNAYLFDLASNLVINLISEGKFSFDDEDDEYDLKITDELNKGLASFALLMVIGNKAAWVKGLAAIGANAAYRYGYYPFFTERGKEGKEFDIYQDSPLFSPDISKQGATGFAGGLGILNNESEKLAKATDKFLSKAMPRLAEGDLTLNEAIDIMNESKMSYYAWKSFNKVTGTPMGGMEYPILKGLDNKDNVKPAF